MSTKKCTNDNLGRNLPPTDSLLSDTSSHQLHVRNHFVPQSYLKRWENSSNKVFVYKTLVAHERIPFWKGYSVSAIAFHKHLYTQILDGKESDELEIWFDRKFESPSSEVINKVTSDGRLSRDDWKILIKYLAAQDVRTPTRMFEHLKHAGQSMPDIMANVLNGVKEKLERKDLEFLKDYDNPDKNPGILPLKVSTEFEEGKDSGKLKVETYIGRSTWIQSIKHVLEHTINVLHQHNWTIVKPAKGYYWPTSDNPVIKLNYLTNNKYDLLGGWGRPKGNIIFPIGPEHALFVQIGDKPFFLKGTRLSVKQTMFIRQLIAENSHRMIFSHVEDKEITTYRQRVVNIDLIKSEKEQWKKWHLDNADLEREYLNKI